MRMPAQRNEEEFRKFKRVREPDAGGGGDGNGGGVGSKVKNVGRMSE
jgi:hypothetical protein